MSSDEFQGFEGTPSDQAPDILAAGHSRITTLFLSMAERHPDGKDADYLRWHSLDHRPEQHRLAGTRASLRVVSTPECRAARAASTEAFDAIDHVMTYFFSGVGDLEHFGTLSVALRDAGRAPFILPPVQRGVYNVESRQAATDAKAGADVLPWVPVRGVYLLLEEGQASGAGIENIEGITGVWSAASIPTGFSSAGGGQRLSYCFLNGDPVKTAQRLKPLLEKRWQQTDIRPLFAAPFHAIVPYQWDRYLP